MYTEICPFQCIYFLEWQRMGMLVSILVVEGEAAGIYSVMVDGSADL